MGTSLTLRSYNPLCSTLTGPFNALCTLLPTRSVDLGAIGKLHTSLSNPSIQTLVRAGLGVLATLTTLAYSKAFITRIPEEEEMVMYLPRIKSMKVEGNDETSN